MKNYRISETFVHHGPNGPGRYFRVQKPSVVYTEIGRILDEDGEDLGPDIVAADCWDDIALERKVTEGARVRVERYTPYFASESEARALAATMKNPARDLLVPVR